MQAPLLQVQQLVKRYRRGWPRAQTSFELQANLRVDGPGVIGVMGPTRMPYDKIVSLVDHTSRLVEGLLS